MNCVRPVHISRIGHASALGLSVAAAAEAQLLGKQDISWRELLGVRYPWFALPFAEEDWMARARLAVSLVADELSAGMSATDFAALPVFIGSSSFDAGAIEAETRKHGDLPVDSHHFMTEIGNALGNISMPWAFSTSCTSGFAALEAAFLMISQGRMDSALVLGLEFRNDSTLAGFSGLGLLAANEADDGLILGEAVAGLLLTARPQAGWRVAACRLGVDGYSVTAPTPDGRAVAANIAEALTDARLTARDIDLVKPHRIRVSSSDEAEDAALNELFGSRRPPEVSFKRQLGHTLGASGPVELTALMSMLDTGEGQSRYGKPMRLLFNLIGFGGSTATLIIERSGELP